MSGGKVYLVGSGPGDPGLLTRRAWGLLESADAVLHDSLVGDDVLDQLPEPVEVVDVGKRPPDRTSQSEINDMLVDRSRDGEAVVRLKGGDPHVFGRGGEEAQYLADADVPFEVVPGVSSAVAAPGVAGIPLTHRDCASSVTVITGHETPDKDESALDWDALADTVVSGGTLVVLMGVRRLSNNVAALREHGVPAETPVAMVQKATWGDERTVSATLATIEDAKEEAGIEPPAVTVVGDVVGVRSETSEWLDR
ncbi:uroporphyrinogen-III C-methyltransferase [Halorussus ruber]|uniref:uroporphyrinogen-III C-methyltransferase n=1 Tax=Halorussus ruber TaxID=1126238 RepID=UPI001FE841B5|nr:uroporphyrinogen-III C-methyltransferase [Halorussus ruber]